MGQRTSIYLPDDLDDRVKEHGLPLGELVRLGLDYVDEKLAGGWRLVPHGGMILEPPAAGEETGDV